jgi:predicted porin
MKKSIIALAVAGALTAPIVAQADATLYGSLRVKVENMKDQELNVADNASRIGIKGSVDTNIDGVKAIYQGEWKVNTADGAAFGAGRLAYVGLTGGFGTAAVGQQWTPYYSMVTGATDILDGNSTAPTQGVGRLGNMIAYITPEMGGFKAAAGMIADNDADGKDTDAYNIAASYTVAGFTAAASLLAIETAPDSDQTAVSLAYANGPVYVAALYQDFEALDDNAWELAGSYAFGDTKLLANYTTLDSLKTYGVEVQHQLGKQARVFANYNVANNDAELAAAADFLAYNTDGLSVGMRVDF